MCKDFRIVVLALCSLLLAPLKAQELFNYPLDTVNGEEVYRYEVEKSIGLFRIGMNFNVPQAELVRLNPQLRQRGLHYGETILIPTGRKVSKHQKPVEPVIQDIPIPEDTIVIEDTIVVADTTEADSTLVKPTYTGPRKVIELALMLPFESMQTKRSTNAERMREFYQGALLALHDLRNDSTLYRLRVYDTERSERRVNELCDSTELDSVRGILGLVYPIQIERMAAWCEVHEVPLLLPFSDDVELAANRQVLQFNTTEQQEIDSLCRWIASQDAKCVTVEVADLSNFARGMRKQLRANDIPYSAMALRDLMNDSAAYALDSTQENIILMHSERYQHIRILLPHLQKLQREGYRIRIVSQYSWQKEEINLPQVFTSVFTAQGEREAYEANWSQYYVGRHVSETPRYDLIGYDLMRTLIGWLDGKKETQGLQSDIRWQQIDNGGYQNAAVQVVTRE
jgi:hypothetical protein